ncbi:glycosyltransferase family A protein [Parapedobacter lycopersici]|uniref:glycosyltransferase family A protein n=1 Tax=Parapedobacter lycopersici TaxID=1864939 RepID=UPI00214D7125|nr:glycosyltransferase family 2 protein [Parapedobacter lycopersici]
MKFSIIMPVHNKAPHLYRSVKSVLEQSYSDFEFIIIDDASSDNSYEILSGFADERIKIFSRDTPGPGGYAARNLGIDKSSSEWISFLDADDEWESTYLECVEQAIRQFPTYEIISTNWDSIYAESTVINSYFEKIVDKYVDFTLTDFFSQNYFIWTSAVTLKKSLIKKVGMFPEGRCKRGGDIDAWIRCLSASEGNVWINEKLAHYHRETVNRVTDNTRNPVGEICSVRSIEYIRQQSKDVRLLKAIDFFLARAIYNKMIIDYRRGAKPATSDLCLIDNKTKRFLTWVKYLLRIFLFEKKGQVFRNSTES